MAAPLQRTESTHRSSPAENPRFVCLQHSSVFESYGGVEYYLNDFLGMVAERFGGSALHAIVPQRTSEFHRADTPYPLTVVPFSGPGLLQKLQNRFSPHYWSAASDAIKKLSPNTILCSHVSLAPMAYTLSKRHGIPYAVLVYGIDCWGNLWPQDEWALRRADRIVSISHWTKNVLVKRGFAEDRIAVVHPIMNPAYENVAQPPAKRDKAPNHPFTLLSVARMDVRERYKGQDHVLLALARIRERWPESVLKYIIQGTGSDLPRLKTLAHDLGLDDWVEFKGAYKDRSDLEALYQSADVFAMPSRFGYWDGRWRGEGFGIVYTEAAAFGLPSLAYRCGGATDIIADGKTGFLVTPDNIEQLSEAIIRWYSNPKLVAEMGQNAFAYAKSHFCRDTVGKQLESALGRI